MGWSGRAPAPPATEAGKGRQDKEHAMSQTLNAAFAVVGIDSGEGAECPGRAGAFYRGRKN